MRRVTTRAVILSAGQGRRLLPLTEKRPKCLVPVRGDRSVLEVQLQALAECGVAEAVVVVGFGAEAVEERLSVGRVPRGMRIRTAFNPVHGRADNLVTAWVAREHLTGRVLLLNGDTLFDPEVARRMLGRREDPALAAVSRKPAYDPDDMKVVLDTDGCVERIGKRLTGVAPDGEAIGMTRLDDAGAAALREALEATVRAPDATDLWYTSALQEMAARVPLRAVDVSDLWWSEIDDREDLEAVRAHFARRPPPARVVAAAPS